MKKWATWGLSAVLIAGGWALVGNVPDDIHETDAFTAPISDDGWASSRNLSVKVDEVSFATTVQQGERIVSTTSKRWVTVQVLAQAITDDTAGGNRIRHAWLVADDVTYRATERMSSGPYQLPQLVGVPTRTSLAFAVPDDFAAETAELQIWGEPVYPVLDTQIAFDLNLADAPHTDVVELVSRELVLP